MSDLSDSNSVLGKQSVTGCLTIAIWLPGHTRDLVLGTQMRRWITMAIETEFHRQRFGAIGQCHGVNAPVTFDAANAFCDVDVVTEENVVGQHGDTIPD